MPKMDWDTEDSDRETDAHPVSIVHSMAPIEKPVSPDPIVTKEEIPAGASQKRVESPVGLPDPESDRSRHLATFEKPLSRKMEEMTPTLTERQVINEREKSNTVSSTLLDLLRPYLGSDYAIVENEVMETGGDPEDIILRGRYMREGDLLECLGKHFRIPVAAERDFSEIDMEMLVRNADRILQNVCLPLRSGQVVLSDPRLSRMINNVLSKIGFRPKGWILSSDRRIRRQIRLSLSLLREPPSAIAYSLKDYAIGRHNPAAACDWLIRYAHRAGASDLHFEVGPQRGFIRMRCFGVMEDVVFLSQDLYRILVDALFMKVKTPRPGPRSSGGGAWDMPEMNLQLRASFYPGIYGTAHNVVLRLLALSSGIVTGEELGYPPSLWDHIVSTAKSSASGVILFIGPTGSGKTTGLFALLSELDTRRKKVIEVADPIEYRHTFGVQAQIWESEKESWSYADALRDALRHDPDILIVGEIRDPESAEIVTQAARTGHIIFSTTHTETSWQAFDRLSDLGVSQRDLLSTLKMVVSQRLFRTLCPHCRRENNHGYVSGSGCRMCISGYVGRYAVPEILTVNRDTLPTVGDGLDRTEPEREEMMMKCDSRYRPLHRAIQDEIRVGKTSLDEAQRVLGSVEELPQSME